ncbi:hypothetical protein ccbrp13_07890 [Ktedonobacteria bacterium brp13]|nr:hypothetical protein ccbrp13_07890 [Ktedonobacteria bacterium brp13]
MQAASKSIIHKPCGSRQLAWHMVNPRLGLRVTTHYERKGVFDDPVPMILAVTQGVPGV